MNEAWKTGARHSTTPKAEPTLLEQYGCGPIRFSGADDGLYERHLLFDDVVPPASAGPHERYRPVARSVRDVLSHVGTVMVCWKEIPEAARSLAAAMPLLVNARRVVLAGAEERDCLTGRRIGRSFVSAGMARHQRRGRLLVVGLRARYKRVPWQLPGPIMPTYS